MNWLEDLSHNIIRDLGTDGMSSRAGLDLDVKTIRDYDNAMNTNKQGNGQKEDGATCEELLQRTIQFTLATPCEQKSSTLQGYNKYVAQDENRITNVAAMTINRFCNCSN